MNQAIIPDREAVKLFWDVKKKVQHEFGVRLQLSEMNVLHKIAEFGVKTEDNQLKQLIAELVSNLEAAEQAIKERSDASGESLYTTKQVVKTLFSNQQDPKVPSGLPKEFQVKVEEKAVRSRLYRGSPVQS